MRKNPEAALEFFKKCSELERSQNSGEKYGFKATKNIVVLAAQLNKVDVMMTNMTQVIQMMNAVSLNDFDEGVNQILDSVTRH